MSGWNFRFRDFEFGEDDANAEYDKARQKHRQPIFIRAFFDHPRLNLGDLRDGERYLVVGQKGTGKTAILRKLDEEKRGVGAITQFVVFRDEIASKEELDRLGSIYAIKVNEVKRIEHYLHVLDRMFMLIILSKLKQEAVAAASHSVLSSLPEASGHLE